MSLLTLRLLVLPLQVTDGSDLSHITGAIPRKAVCAGASFNPFLRLAIPRRALPWSCSPFPRNPPRRIVSNGVSGNGAYDFLSRKIRQREALGPQISKFLSFRYNFNQTRSGKCYLHVGCHRFGVLLFSQLQRCWQLALQAPSSLLPPVPTKRLRCLLPSPAPRNGRLRTATERDALPPAPEPAAAGAAGQYDNKGGGGKGGWSSKLAFEGGGGYDISSGNTSNYVNSGWDIAVGGGLHFSRAFSTLIEYQFIE